MRNPTQAERILRQFGISFLRGDSLIDVVRRGLPTSAAKRFMKRAGLSPEAVMRAISISARTFARRKGKRLDTPQSDRLVRVARIFDIAVECLGSTEKASGWLQWRNPSLKGSTPLELLDTEVGALEIEALLESIADGGIA